MDHLITILTPTYNRADTFLSQTIESIQRQVENGFKHEHIIIDDASTDGTRGLVERYMKEDTRIRYVHSPKNGGTANALNLGFVQSNGSLSLPFDDDDLLPPRGLQMHHDFMQTHPDVSWSFGYALNIDQDNRLLGLSERIPFFTEDNQVFLTALLDANSIPNGAVIIRREAIAKVGGWDINVGSQDWDMWVKLAYHGLSAALHKNYLAFYRVHRHQLTTEHSTDGTWGKDGAYLRALYQEKLL